MNAALPRVEATAADRPARARQVPVQPPPPRHRLRERRPTLRRPGGASTGRIERAPRPRTAGRPRARAGREGAALRLQGLRRLLAPRDRLRVSGVAVREEPAQRPVRRHARRSVRGVRHGVHLVGGVRAAQGLRRGGVDARRPGRRKGQRARRGRAPGRTRSSAATTWRRGRAPSSWGSARPRHNPTGRQARAERR